MPDRLASAQAGTEDTASPGSEVDRQTIDCRRGPGKGGLRLSPHLQQHGSPLQVEQVLRSRLRNWHAACQAFGSDVSAAVHSIYAQRKAVQRQG